VVLVVTTVEKDATRERQKTGQQKQKYFEAFLAPVHKVAVEDVRVLRGR
jgi:hypothetical protein